MRARGRYRSKKKKKEKDNPQKGGRHDRRNTQHCYSNEAIYPPTDSSTAERSTTVSPTKRSTHPPCITAAVQQMTCTAVVVERERWNHDEARKQKKCETRQTPRTRTHSTIYVLTHQPTQQPTDAPIYPPTMWYSNTAEYSSSRCVDDDTRYYQVDTRY